MNNVAPDSVCDQNSQSGFEGKTCLKVVQHPKEEHHKYNYNCHLVESHLDAVDSLNALTNVLCTAIFRITSAKRECLASALLNWQSVVLNSLIVHLLIGLSSTIRRTITVIQIKSEIIRRWSCTRITTDEGLISSQFLIGFLYKFRLNLLIWPLDHLHWILDHHNDYWTFHRYNNNMIAHLFRQPLLAVVDAAANWSRFCFLQRYISGRGEGTWRARFRLTSTDPIELTCVDCLGVVQEDGLSDSNKAIEDSRLKECWIRHTVDAASDNKRLLKTSQFFIFYWK